MAVNKAPAAQAGTGEVSEREYQATLNRAVADTEEEIFRDALGEGELGNDGDTSLEEMGDGLEGEVEDDADEEAEGEVEEGEEDAEGEDGDEAESAEGEEGEGEGGERQEQPRDQRGQFRDREPAVPPGRLREQTQRATAAEERARDLERTVNEMNGRLAELSARANAPPQRQQQTEAPPKPDMFADPDGYERWVLEQAERRVAGTIEQGFSRIQQQQQAREAQRVDESLADAARGERAFEFGAAYNALTSLNPNDPKARATVAKIYNSGDGAAKALFDWWEDNGGPEYRERILEQLAPRQQRNGSRGRGDDRSGDRQQQQPRHVIRPGQRLPSLNSATGSNSQRVNDPEMLDGSERSIFEYGTRR